MPPFPCVPWDERLASFSELQCWPVRVTLSCVDKSGTAHGLMECLVKGDTLYFTAVHFWMLLLTCQNAPASLNGRIVKLLLGQGLMQMTLPHSSWIESSEGPGGGEPYDFTRAGLTPTKQTQESEDSEKRRMQRKKARMKPA